MNTTKTRLIGICLGTTVTLSLFSNAIFAGDMPTVTINGNYILTYPTDTSQVCKDELAKNGCKMGAPCTNKTLKFANCTGVTLTFQGGSGTCTNSQAEFYLSTSGSTYDISLVNGYSGPVSITGGAASLHADSATSTNKGVYPYGCSQCSARTSGDCGYNTFGPKAGCSKTQDCQINNDASKSYTVTFN